MNRTLALKTTHFAAIMTSCSLLLATTMAFSPSAQAATAVVVTTEPATLNVTPVVRAWPYYTGPVNTVNVNNYNYYKKYGYKGSGYKAAGAYHYNNVYHSNRYRSANANGGVDRRGYR